MFIYQLKGLSINISLPSLTLSCPNEFAPNHMGYFTRNNLLEKLKEFKLTLCPARDMDEHHFWYHAPVPKSKRNHQFNGSACPNLLQSYLPPFESEHYHFFAMSDHPLHSIFQFLHAIAEETEKGAMQYLSMKDLADLKWHYQQYLSTFSLAFFSDLIGKHAMRLNQEGEGFHKYDVLQHLAELRFVVEKNIPAKSPNMAEIAKSVLALQQYAWSDIQDLYKSGNGLLQALQAGKKGYDQVITPDILALLTEGPCPAKQRLDQRWTMHPFFALMLILILASKSNKLLAPTSDDSKNIDNLLETICMMLIVSLASYIPQSHQEIRHFGRGIKYSIFNLFSKKEPIQEIPEPEPIAMENDYGLDCRIM